MAQAVPARLDAHFGVDPPAADRAQARSPAAALGDIRITVHEDLSAIEQDWRAFEPHADCTVFQSFDWLATWQRLIGVRNGVRPAIVVARDGAGAILFLLPLAVRSAGFARELTWLGSELCDYNAPLLAADFLRADRRHAFHGVVGNHCAWPARQSAPALRFHQSGKNAGNGRRATKSDAVPGRHDDPERGLFDPSHRRLGNLLCGQAFVGDAAARPHQTQTAGRARRGQVRQPGERQRNLAHARHADGAEGAIVCPHGCRQSVRQAGPCGILSRACHRSGDPASRACEPARRGRDRRRRQPRADLSRLLLSPAGELRRRRGLPLRAGRRSSARLAALCHRPRIPHLRFHHRRRTLQTRLVRYRAEALRLISRRRPGAARWSPCRCSPRFGSSAGSSRRRYCGTPSARPAPLSDRWRGYLRR